MPESPRSEFAEFDFSEFTEEDFKSIDAAVAAKLDGSETQEIEDETFYAGDRHSIYSDAFSLRLSSLGPEELQELDTAIAGHFETIEAPQRSSQLSAAEAEDPSQVSFQSDVHGLNLNRLDIEELAALDSFVATKLSQLHGGPQVQIRLDDDEDQPQLPYSQPLQVEAQLAPVEPELELEPMRPVKTAWGFHYFSNWSKLSPMQQYRRHGVFSVTDLVSPAWCELQFDYGLRGKRSRPAKDRPATFKSASGKTIRVEKKVSADNEVITKHGQAVHKQLEKEVKPEEIKVDVTTNETRWALRLINMINSLESLSYNFTREMPVFGIVHGEVVVGIIDEVDRVENAYVHEHSPKRRQPELSEGASRKRARTSEVSLEPVPVKKDKGKMREIDVSNVATDDGLRSQQKSKSFFLRLKDNKTRGAMSLPSDDDAYSGKMQLMLYRRLLQELFATSPFYDFTPLWQKANVNSKAIFPERFLLQAPLVDPRTGLASTCLDDLVARWHSAVEVSNVTAIDPTLELVYRLRRSKRRQKPIAYLPRGDPEDEDLARAILASLADLSPEVCAGEITVQASGVGPSIGPSSKNDISDADADDAALRWALEQSLKDVSEGTGNNEPENDTKATLQLEEKSILGTKVFSHNDQELDGYIGNILRWWRGERKAQGVDIERTYRCNTCEYSADCEWREEKALEFSARSTTLVEGPTTKVL